MSNEDQARLIAERVARRLAGNATVQEPGAPITRNGPERSPEYHRARIINFVSAAPPSRTQPSISSRTEATQGTEATEATLDIFESRAAVPQVAQSPWLAPFTSAFGGPSGSRQNSQSAIPDPQSPTHASQERFGVEEAAVSELVEFFENEKQCAVDPSGKPCDHCAMCSSRGF